VQDVSISKHGQNKKLVEENEREFSAWCIIYRRGPLVLGHSVGCVQGHDQNRRIYPRLSVALHIEGSRVDGGNGARFGCEMQFQWKI
jgi:hypothetical protein